MTSLPRPHPSTGSNLVPLSATAPHRGPHAGPVPRGGLMRKYEIKCLVGRNDIEERQIIAPATRLFEDTASAFARGTLVPTTDGPVAVEDLLPGDLIVTELGPEPVVWIGSTTFVPGTADTSTTLKRLFRIPAGSHGLGQPLTDLVLGPAARMAIRRAKFAELLGKPSVLAPVSDYADGEMIVELTPPGSVQLYHFALERHGTVKIGGIDMETYHPGRSIGADLGPNTRALFLSMFPNVPDLHGFGELTMTRTTRDVIDNLVSA